jgi:hypothetical protein
MRVGERSAQPFMSRGPWRLLPEARPASRQCPLQWYQEDGRRILLPAVAEVVESE